MRAPEGPPPTAGWAPSGRLTGGVGLKPITDISPAVNPAPAPPGGGVSPMFVAPINANVPRYYAGERWRFGEELSTRVIGGGFTIQPTASVVSAGGTQSIAQLALIRNRADSYHTVELGTIVNPRRYPDGLPHVFTYINRDGYATNGLPGGDCYNCEFVAAAGAAYAPGQAVAPTTSATFELASYFFRNNWWVYAGGNWMGYLRSGFWSGTFIDAGRFDVYGEVYDASGPNTQMGNGRSGTSAGSSVMSAPYVWLTTSSSMTIAGHQNQADNGYPSNGTYNVGNYSANRRAWRYGGPTP